MFKWMLLRSCYNNQATSTIGSLSDGCNFSCTERHRTYSQSYHLHGSLELNVGSVYKVWKRKGNWKLISKVYTPKPSHLLTIYIPAMNAIAAEALESESGGHWFLKGHTLHQEDQRLPLFRNAVRSHNVLWGLLLARLLLTTNSTKDWISCCPHSTKSPCTLLPWQTCFSSLSYSIDTLLCSSFVTEELTPHCTLTEIEEPNHWNLIRFASSLLLSRDWASLFQEMKEIKVSESLREHLLWSIMSSRKIFLSRTM